RVVVRKTKEIWRAFELGPAGTRVHGHTVETPFLEQRRALFLEYGLAPAEAAELARQTSGLWGEELRQAMTRYRETGRMPGRFYQEGQCPLDPIHGYYIERLIDPYDLVEKLRRAGLRPRLRAYLGGARGGAMALANEVLTRAPLTPLALRVARSFRLVAVKVER
ncbi:MAG: hypothetical protein H5T69_16325, partial [Chloroflexi bacterium]|nr:hypothetical protein [Chloroflexota bacterium]